MKDTDPQNEGVLCTWSLSHVWLFANSMDCNPPRSSLHGDSPRVRILEPAKLLCPWGFSRQEYWNGLPSPPPGDLPDPGISQGFSTAGRFFTAEPPGKPIMSYTHTQKATSVYCSFSPRPDGTVSCLTYSSLQPFQFCFWLENIPSFLPSLHAVTSIPNPIVFSNALPSEWRFSLSEGCLGTGWLLTLHAFKGFIWEPVVDLE